MTEPAMGVADVVIPGIGHASVELSDESAVVSIKSAWYAGDGRSGSSDLHWSTRRDLWDSAVKRALKIAQPGDDIAIAVLFALADLVTKKGF